MDKVIIAIGALLVLVTLYILLMCAIMATRDVFFEKQKCCIEECHQNVRD